MEDSSNETIIICLDKNHPQNALPKTIDTINRITASAYSKNIKIQKIALIPEIIENYLDYPFSLAFLL
jgi:hypothetical protein